MLPPGNCLIEPFSGSGALFLNTHFQEYILADNNYDLINLHQNLQSKGESFIDNCRKFFTPFYNNEDQYYELREVFNNNADSELKAVLFLYLNRHGYNGLCRYNTKGKFNVPFGRYSQPYFPETEMRSFYKKAENAVFKVADFRETMKQAKLGSVIYCDPPYVPLTATANFTGFGPGGFGYKDQLDLAEIARECANRGIPVLISNHATEFTLEAYAGAKLEFINVQRNISCDGNNRRKVKEILACFARNCSDSSVKRVVTDEPKRTQK